MVGYCIGRFGLFGVKQLTGEIIYCDVGCFLILCSFFAMVFVEANHNEDNEDNDDSEASEQESTVEWTRGASQSVGPMAAECDMRFMATGGFSVYGVP